jgi:flagellar M-ring protein FliF
MPPQIQALLANRRLLAIIGGALALLVILSVFFMMQGGGNKNQDPSDLELTKEQMTLAKVTTLGRAIEIQALLARQGIHVNYDDTEGDTKIKIKFTDKAHLKDRDKALITLVQSGLMDNNVGLEAFDKGDLTASREEKRIKLVRSQQGELARLIKKIDPIEDAAVSIAIPEQTIFRTDEKPITASVQVSLPSGTTLTHDQVRAIANLVVGSVQGLDDKHLSVSDTNGHTYSSILNSGADINDKIQEQDNYMRQKVATQMDRLVGAGNYVVTVSTELRQASREVMVEQFDPQGAVVSNKQSFNENLGNKGSGGAGGPASTFIPNAMGGGGSASGLNVPGGPPNNPASIGTGNIQGMPQGTSGTLPVAPVAENMVGTSESGNKNYVRNGVDVNYSNSKTQWVETNPVGMTEDISIAVTIDNSHFPDDININELQTLIARAASPKVRPEHVSIAKTDMRSGLPLEEGGSGGGHSKGNMPETPADMSWMYWAGGAVLVCLFLMMMLSLSRKKESNPLDEGYLQTQQEVQHLRELAAQQQAQLQATQEQTQMLMETQQRQMEQIQMRSATPEYAMPGGGASYPESMPVGNGPAQESRQSAEDLELQRALDELRETVRDDEEDDDHLDFQIKSWIESS